MTPPRSIPDAKRPMSRSPVLALGTQSGPPHPAGGGRGGSYNVLLGLEGTLAELRLEQLVQGAAGEAGGEERLRRSHDFPLPVGNLKGRARGGSGVGQAWVRRGSGVCQACVRGGSGVDLHLLLESLDRPRRIPGEEVDVCRAQLAALHGGVRLVKAAHNVRAHARRDLEATRRGLRREHAPVGAHGPAQVHGVVGKGGVTGGAAREQNSAQKELQRMRPRGAGSAGRGA